MSPSPRSGWPQTLHQLFQPSASSDWGVWDKGHVAAGKLTPSESLTPAAGSLLSPSASLPALSLRSVRGQSSQGDSPILALIPHQNLCSVHSVGVNARSRGHPTEGQKKPCSEPGNPGSALLINYNEDYSNMLRESQMYL